MCSSSWYVFLRTIRKTGEPSAPPSKRFTSPLPIAPRPMQLPISQVFPSYQCFVAPYIHPLSSCTLYEHPIICSTNDCICLIGVFWQVFVSHNLPFQKKQKRPERIYQSGPKVISFVFLLFIFFLFSLRPPQEYQPESIGIYTVFYSVHCLTCPECRYLTNLTVAKLLAWYDSCGRFWLLFFVLHLVAWL